MSAVMMLNDSAKGEVFSQTLQDNEQPSAQKQSTNGKCLSVAIICIQMPTHPEQSQYTSLFSKSDQVFCIFNKRLHVGCSPKLRTQYLER